MALYLYLQAKELHAISFHSPLSTFLKEHYPNLIIFEADQFSEPLHLQTGLQFIDKSQKIILHIEDDSKQGLGSIVKMLEKIRKSNNELLILYAGDNQKLLNTQKILKGRRVSSDFEKEIKNFLS